MSTHPKDTGLLRAYRSATNVLGPLLPLWVNRRAKQGKEDPSRLAERRGIASLARPEGALIWMHGASVGECTMLLPLIAHCRRLRPDISILITSATMTAAKLMDERLPEGCVHQYVPLDRPSYVTAFLDHWQPGLALWAESEIWPNMIGEVKSRGIPMALINARMSKKSLEGWAKRKSSATALFSKFDLILAADKMTGDSLGWFTGRDIPATGNLKDAGLPLPVDADELRALTRAVGSRPVWCAASTHKGEDDLVVRAHIDVLCDHPDALIILAPRHPERAEKIAQIIASHGLSYARRSLGEIPDKNTQIYLFDTIGEMGLAYRLAQLSFVCGSLVDGLSGHNPLEPARLGSAVMTGGHISSFAECYGDMFRFGAAKRILSPDIIGKEVSALFSAPQKLRDLRRTAQSYVNSRDSVLDFVWAELSPLLPNEGQS